MARRFKQPDPKFAPKNYTEQPKEREYIALKDEKLLGLLRRVDQRVATKHYDAGEGFYLRLYLKRMRADWGAWLDSTPDWAVICGGLAEIDSHKRAERWESQLTELRAQHSAEWEKINAV